ncbi:DUF4064 domain-containing protein [Lentibacillus sp. CBA3610]|uniref:DUF4064 domain-containing protein n=1 Tax=Lentibacillus sp. CBA3610 TaxID=2518176 RepID=UPI001595BD52|nr:DUF4064 domain-containing protein [Lentibacillus sp. CBA3610]QKY71069.1 DUF4064 domain-containing protein [Lentibacillus sp. CBA3610]
MRRTAEIVLSVIGALIYGFFAFIGVSMVWLFNQETFWDQTSEELKQQPDINSGDVEVALEALQGSGQGSGWFLIIASVIAVIMGIVAIILVKGNKKPKAAGIILIVAAVLGSLTVLGIFGGIFLLIAGIMCLARKAPPANTVTE